MNTNALGSWFGRVTDADVLRTVAAARDVRRARGRASWADWINAGVLASLTGSGLVCPYGVGNWYLAFAVSFVGIAGAVLASAALITFVAERQSEREQGPRRKPAPIAREIRDTTVSAWVSACLLAWPLARLWSGNAIGLVWTLEEAGGALRTGLETLAAVLLLDAWLYWKHRLLHTRLMFPFHRQHHSFRDPTALAGFAVGPVEGLLTFWPIIILAMPQAIHYAPLYFSLSIGFILLNLYLHCGVSVRIIEALLPPLFFNTSHYHNRHHANAEVNYAEAFTIWDHLCRTREQDLQRGGTGAR
jgi:sterol desaturase/sphingolipid hydroxylase (fatty acid hydroxylase superfamily)